MCTTVGDAHKYVNLNGTILTLVVLLVFWSAAHLEHDFHVVRGTAAADSAVDVVFGRRGCKQVHARFVRILFAKTDTVRTWARYVRPFARDILSPTYETILR